MRNKPEPLSIYVAKIAFLLPFDESTQNADIDDWNWEKCIIRDFPTFLKSGPGACWIWEIKHLDDQNWENLMQSKRTGPQILNGLKKYIWN